FCVVRAGWFAPPAASSAVTVTVNVTTFNGKRLRFDMQSGDTIASVKQRIQEKENLAAPIFERVKVCWEDPYHEKQSLKDDLTISNYTGATTMHLTTEMVRKRPQQPVPRPPPPHSPPPPPPIQPVANRTLSTASSQSSSSSSSSSSFLPSQSMHASLPKPSDLSHPEIRAVDTALEGKSVFITGPAGTAKV